MDQVGLYRFEDLSEGLDLNEPASYLRTWDFRQFQKFVRESHADPPKLSDAIVQSTHDASIAHHLHLWLADQNQALVGIMGGHELKRSDKAYRLIADVARRLTRDGLLIATGGGPGAMEAGHVGAWFAGVTDYDYEQAMANLQAAPDLPEMTGIVKPDGSVATGREDDIGGAHKWLVSALTVRNTITVTPGVSLAIPTWLYGGEPSTPFATRYAKYFANSIREEALVHRASAGIVYARGGGGTLREVFEDAEQNYYAAENKAFTPMIFVDPEDYWRTEPVFERDVDDDLGKVITRGIKLDRLLRRTFEMRLAPERREACLARLVFTTDIDQISEVLRQNVAWSKMAVAAPMQRLAFRR